LITSLIFFAASVTITHDQIVSVYDGDTFTVKIQTNPDFFDTIPIRILGVDTPEIRGKCHEEKELAKTARRFVINQLINAKTIELKNIKQDKYFRLDAKVLVDQKDIAHLLINQNLARPYDGTKRQTWCPNY
jgi:micrococcal nuclease